MARAHAAARRPSRSGRSTRSPRRRAAPAVNPFDPRAAQGGSGNPFDPFGDDDDEPIDNPFAPRRERGPAVAPDAPRKVQLLGRGLAVFGSYAKVLEADGEPAAYCQFGPLSAYPRAQRVRDLYPKLPSSPLPAVITCIATTSAARGPGPRARRSSWRSSTTSPAAASPRSRRIPSPRPTPTPRAPPTRRSGRRAASSWRSTTRASRSSGGSCESRSRGAASSALVVAAAARGMPDQHASPAGSDGQRSTARPGRRPVDPPTTVGPPPSPTPRRRDRRP